MKIYFLILFELKLSQIRYRKRVGSVLLFTCESLNIKRWSRVSGQIRISPNESRETAKTHGTYAREIEQML